MSEIKDYSIIRGYKNISFSKDFQDDEDADAYVTLVIKEGGCRPLHIELSTDEVAQIIKGFNWHKKINKGDKP